MVTWARQPAPAAPAPDLISAAGVQHAANLARADAQNVCRYFVTSTFSGSVPVCTEKSMNFWKSALSLASGPWP